VRSVFSRREGHGRVRFRRREMHERNKSRHRSTHETKTRHRAAQRESMAAANQNRSASGSSYDTSASSRRRGDRRDGDAHRRDGLGPVPCPRRRTLLRDPLPFKDKDCPQHFESARHKRLIDIHSADAQDGRLAASAWTIFRRAWTSNPPGDLIAAEAPSAPEPTTRSTPHHVRHPRQEARHDPGLPGGTDASRA